jgi:amino acid adenylation domain-containing protein
MTERESPSPDRRKQLLEALVGRTKGPERPLSAGQRALWFLHAMAPESPAFNIAFAARIVSPLDAAALERAFQGLVDRRRALRAHFPAEHGEPRQVIRETLAVPFELTDAATWSEQRLQEEVVREARRPFALEKGPLLRVSLLTRSREESCLVLTFHHIVADGWSLWLCLSELGELYQAARLGVPPELPPVGGDLDDYLSWQARVLGGREGKRLRAYWKEGLGGELPVLAVPLDKVRPPVPRFRGASHRFGLSVALTERLKQLGHEVGASLQMAVLAVFEMLLHRYTGQSDFVIGAMASGRSRAELDDVVGYLANPLALRARVLSDDDSRTVLRRVREALLDALDHQDYPFPLVVEDVGPYRDPSRSPLFQVLFAFEKPQRLERDGAAAFVLGEPGGRMELGGLLLETLPIAAQQEGQFDLTLVAVEVDGRLSLSFDYCTDLFEEATIARMAGHFLTLVESVVSRPGEVVGTLPLLTADERTRIREWNDTEAPIVGDCVHHLFEERAARDPGAVAAVFEGARLTYDELDARANRLAHLLRRQGVAPDRLVGLCAERSLELVVGLLGILKAGGAFVPLDPTYPDERLRFMLEDSRVSVLLGQGTILDRLDNSRFARIPLDDPAIPDAHPAEAPAVDVSPDHLAYLIYTSGSTGRPKGVLIEHRGLVNVAREQQRFFGVGPGSRVLQFASLSFDAAVFEIVMALCSGAALHLGSRESLLPGPPLLEKLHSERISVVTLPPSALLNVPVADLPGLATVTVAGEACPAEVVARWGKNRRFFNLYGPTEATIWATAVECREGAGTPTIGRPIANTETYVLDARLQPVPVGIPGELYLGGVGLARGYMNQPELTASRFVRHPFSDAPGARLYRTGDLVRRLESGELDYLGRTDFQVKLRGFRIELGEIEAVLAQHPDVNEAVVLAREDDPGDRRLAAYVVAAPKRRITPAALRGHLRSRLPDFMVPAAFVLLDTLPKTPGGKVDRRALPRPEGRFDDEDGEGPPADTLEQRLAAIWQQVLRVERVGLHDNFFDLGGNSLLLAQLHARLGEAELRVPSLIDLFRFPTVSALAAQMRGDGGSVEGTGTSARERGEALLTGQDRLREQQARRRGVRNEEERG